MPRGFKHNVSSHRRRLYAKLTGNEGKEQTWRDGEWGPVSIDTKFFCPIGGQSVSFSGLYVNKDDCFL